jgi:hypothetical protein
MDNSVFTRGVRHDSMFVSAGRLGWVLRPLPVFLLSPDKGNPGNVAGFCVALAP